MTQWIMYTQVKVKHISLHWASCTQRTTVQNPDEDLAAEVRQSSGLGHENLPRMGQQNRFSGSPTSHSIIDSSCLIILIRVSEYDPSSVSYQNSEPSYGSRPGTAPGLPAPHQAEVLKVPQVTVTSPGNNARLELVD